MTVHAWTYSDAAWSGAGNVLRDARAVVGGEPSRNFVELIDKQHPSAITLALDDGVTVGTRA